LSLAVEAGSCRDGYGVVSSISGTVASLAAGNRNRSGPTTWPIDRPLQTGDCLSDSAIDPQVFWQIHRSAVVNVKAIEAVHRLSNGRLEVRLKGLERRLFVSDRYAHLFRQM
jgi:hypothetical protein